MHKLIIGQQSVNQPCRKSTPCMVLAVGIR